MPSSGGVALVSGLVCVFAIVLSSDKLLFFLTAETQRAQMFAEVIVVFSYDPKNQKALSSAKDEREHLIVVPPCFGYPLDTWLAKRKPSLAAVSGLPVWAERWACHPVHPQAPERRSDSACARGFQPVTSLL